MAVQSTLTLISLPIDLQREIEDVLDMVSLLALGGTCFHFRDRVSTTLKRERDAIIERYWPNAPDFLRMLSRSQAVITGEAALAFVMRNNSLLSDELEVAVSAAYSDDLLGDFDTHPLVQRAWPQDAWSRLDHDAPTAYLYISPSGQLIRIICSHTDSLFTQMAYYPSTSLCNYMDEFSFGCTYRDLTLNRTGVASMALTDDEDSRVLLIELRAGFRHSAWPADVAFPPRPFALDVVLGQLDADTEDLVNTVCLRDWFQCPGQPRSYGDEGSLIDFFEPDMVDHAVMAHWHYPPYGKTALWRMDGGDCDYGCAGGDWLLRSALSDVCVIARPCITDRSPQESSLTSRSENHNASKFSQHIVAGDPDHET